VVFVAARGERRGLVSKVIGFLTEGLGATRGADTDYIKRVIGLPGETVEMQDGVVTVTRLDGTTLALREPYIAENRDLRSFGPFTVPADSYFVMGDNRPESSDSRSSLGPIKRSDIVGKAFVKVWPPGRAGLLEVPGYGNAAPAGSIIMLGAMRRRRPRSGVGRAASSRAALSSLRP
jgi:signal peptidase I